MNTWFTRGKNGDEYMTLLGYSTEEAIATSIMVVCSIWIAIRYSSIFRNKIRAAHTRKDKISSKYTKHFGYVFLITGIGILVTGLNSAFWKSYLLEATILSILAIRVEIFYKYFKRFNSLNLLLNSEKYLLDKIDDLSKRLLSESFKAGESVTREQLDVAFNEEIYLDEEQKIKIIRRETEVAPLYFETFMEPNSKFINHNHPGLIEKIKLVDGDLSCNGVSLLIGETTTFDEFEYHAPESAKGCKIHVWFYEKN